MFSVEPSDVKISRKPSDANATQNNASDYICSVKCRNPKQTNIYGSRLRDEKIKGVSFAKGFNPNKYRCSIVECLTAYG